MCGRCVRQSERRSVGFRSFLSEPGSQARVVDGGQVLHVSRLGEPRYSRPPCRLRTYTSKRRASCPGSRTHRPTPTRSTAPTTGTGRCPTTTATCRLPSGANRRPSTTRSPLSTTSTLVAGSAEAARVEVPATAPRALGERVHYLRAVKGFPFAPRPGPRAGPVLRRRPDRRDRRDRPRRRAPGASRPRQPAAARRATPATIRSASTRRGSVRGRRRSRSRGARSSSSP